MLISFKTNSTNDVHYGVDCTNGKKFSGVAKPVKSPLGGLVAVALKSFPITKTENYFCALKTTAPGAAKLHKWKGHKFKCVSREIDPASQDVTHVPPAPPAPVPPPENPTETNPEVPFKLEGQLSFVDPDAPQCRRTMKALFTILSSRPDPIGYRLNCHNGPNLYGAMQSVPHAEGYLFTGLRNISISTSKSLRCELNARIGQSYRVVAVESYKAECRSGIAPPRQPTKSFKRPVRVQPPRRSSPPTVNRPKCTTQWKTTCNRTPVRSCQNVVSQQCRTVPKVSCTNQPTRTCQRIPKRTCRAVRGRQVCTTQWTNKCRRTVKRSCKRSSQRVCSLKVTRKCTTAWKKTCNRQKKTICRR